MTNRTTHNLWKLKFAVWCFVLSLAANSQAADKDKPCLPKHLDSSEWSLIWEDDFSGKTIDGTKWEHCPQYLRGVSNWSDQEAYLDGNGNLVVQISKKNDKVFSGAVRTKDKFERKYGYFEIRCKVPVIKGGWCAFWMMPFYGDLRKGEDGKGGTEIDIFESIWAENGKIQHALYWGGYSDEDLKGKPPKELSNRADLYHGYHTYAVKWTEKEYVFYIDDKPTWRTAKGGVMRVPAYMKITIEAACWAGDVKQEKLPKRMIVDYVRVYGRACK